MNKRIAIVNDIGSLGGIEMMLLVLARELPRDRYTPVYLAPESGAMIEQMEALGVEVIRAPRPRWWSVSFYIGQRKVFNPLALLYDGWVTLRYIGALRRALRVGRIDLVHSSGMVSQICAGVAARSLGLPHVAQVQDIIGSRLIRRWYGALLGRLTDRIAAISTAVATADLPIAKTQIVPNVVDLDRWQGGHLTRAALSLSDTQFVIGMVGRLTPWKGQRVFLAAARALLESGGQADRCRFVLVGDDSIGSVAGYRAELEADAQRGVLRDRVQLLGRRTSRSLPFCIGRRRLDRQRGGLSRRIGSGCTARRFTRSRATIGAACRCAGRDGVVRCAGSRLTETGAVRDRDRGSDGDGQTCNRYRAWWPL